MLQPARAKPQRRWDLDDLQIHHPAPIFSVQALLASWLQPQPGMAANPAGVLHAAPRTSGYSASALAAVRVGTAASIPLQWLTGQRGTEQCRTDARHVISGSVY